MATIPLRGLHQVSVKQTYFDQETRAKIIDYSMEVENLPTADVVLNRLDDIISENNPIRVQGANRFPTKVGDWRRIELGKNTFLHRDVPRFWTEEWIAFVKSGHCLGLMTVASTAATTPNHNKNRFEQQASDMGVLEKGFPNRRKTRAQVRELPRQGRYKRATILLRLLLL